MCAPGGIRTSSVSTRGTRPSPPQFLQIVRNLPDPPQREHEIWKPHLAAHLRHLPGAAASRAYFFLARFRASSVANVADVQPRDAQLFAGAAHRLRKRNINMKFEISAGLAFLRRLRRIRAAKKLAEEVAKACASARALRALAAKIKSAKIEVDVLGRLPVARARRCATARTRHVETKLVVHLPLLRVRKHFVRFLDLLEFLLC